jgi:peptidoglycan/LPS O-acetylase OafA/YrhL
MASQTPADRNRYVDFLRAISILVVIIGHWLIATAWFVDGELSQGHLLKEQPQTQWLTWLFQVMPIFFIVGGYSNAVSLESAKRKGVGYGGWLAARLNRLVAPLLILIVAWAVIAIVMRLMGVTSPVVQFASQAALIPTWFLAIYIMIVILAPYAYRFWRRFGFLSFWIFVAAAAACDALYFLADIRWPGWSNYFWVWLAVHHLGFAWRDDRMGRARTLLVYAAIGFAVLYLLIMKGPYPLAMVGSPDEGLSNTLPPKITLLALGVFQFGILLALQQPMRRLLDNARLWTATVLVNSMIMTVYLWHITVMVVVVSVLFLLDGFGLRTEPGTAEWWMWRPAWVLLLAVLLVPVAMPLSTYERRGLKSDAAIPPVWRQILGAILLCLGISLLAMFGYGGGPLPRFMVGSVDLDVGSFLLVIIGAATSGLLPRLRAAK